MSNTFYERIEEKFESKKVDIRTYSPLTLAYIGDAVYDTVVRSVVTGRGNVPNKKLHNETIKYVSATAQAKIIERIMDRLTEDEVEVYRRGKNAKPSSTAKNANLKDYLKATGFEALIGYLYLTGAEERMLELIRFGMDIREEE